MVGTTRSAGRKNKNATQDEDVPTPSPPPKRKPPPKKKGQLHDVDLGSLSPKSKKKLIEALKGSSTFGPKSVQQKGSKGPYDKFTIGACLH